MTQMGLEYEKLLESQTHNRRTEALDAEKNRISKQEADTKSYSASFEPRRVTATESQADSAARAQNLKEKYAEREMKAKEKTSSASALQAAVANRRFSPEQLERAIAASELQARARMGNADAAAKSAYANQLKSIMDNLDDVTAAQLAAIAYNQDYGGGLDPFMAGINAGVGKATDALLNSVPNVMGNLTKNEPPKQINKYKEEHNYVERYEVPGSGNGWKRIK